MLEINPGLSIWTFIIFGVLLVLLTKMGWKPMLESLKRREDAISDSLSKAEEARAQAEKLIAETERERKRHEDDLQRQLREGREYADKVRQEMMAKAHEDAHELLELAKQQIVRDTKAAIITLRNEAADLAVEAAGKLIDENLNDTKHKQVVQKFISEIPAVAN
jgi:F-type H+-transporting ATPase subunit b